MLVATLEQRVVESDGELDLEAVERIEARPFVAFLNHHRPLDTDETLGRVLLLDARRLDQENEGAGAAVHDRYFGGADIHVGIVDAQTRERRQQMLDRGNTGFAPDQRSG